MMNYKLTPYSIHELGQRQNQEDSLFPAFGKSTVNDRLFILCDGMGGHEKGEVASATVCETMSNTILSRWSPNEPLSDELLQQAIEDAYNALDAKDNGEEKKMGTTMTFLCFHAEGATVAHIGDSRVYQLRPATKQVPAQIVFKTRDHSLVNDLVDIGEITEEEAKNHPQKNVITRAMQPCQERRAKATIAHLTDIQAGDYFYMCSDGMLEQTSDDNLLFIITNQKKSDKEKVELLRNVTEDNKDNHTAHLIHINKVEGMVAAAMEPESTTTQGTWVTPEAEKPKRGKFMPLLLAIVALLAIAASVFFFMNPFSGKEGDEEIKDSVNTEVKQTIVAPKRGAQKAEQADSTPKNDNQAATTKQEYNPTTGQPEASEPSSSQTSVSKFLPKVKNSKADANN